jgi:hypothetical protein
MREPMPIITSRSNRKVTDAVNLAVMPKPWQYISIGRRPERARDPRAVSAQGEAVQGNEMQMRMSGLEDSSVENDIVRANRISAGSLCRISPNRMLAI